MSEVTGRLAGERRHQAAPQHAMLN
ncbi:hypothetical protein BVI434_1110033 [Burkholderia vietnamiensis]|nr:hypothetical protein BVI434_1110033 [Burkholderia vietnamiensis]